MPTNDKLLLKTMKLEARATEVPFEVRRLTMEQVQKGYGFSNEVGCYYIQYMCPECDEDLTPGPSGGGTNQVCESCKTNYGCLPGGLDR